MNIKEEEYIDKFLLNEIEMKTITAGIYYKQLKEIAEFILNLPRKERKKFIIFCKYSIFQKCKQIGDYFKLKTKISEYLPENVLCIIAKNTFLGI